MHPSAAFAAADVAAAPTTDPNLGILGAGVVKPLSDASRIVDASSAFTPRSGTWTYEVVFGANAGQTAIETLAAIGGNQRPAWRRSRAPGHQTDFVITPEGVFKTRVTDPAHNLVFDYTPGEPELINGMSPGEKRHFNYAVRAFDSSTPTATKASGQLDVEFTYLGLTRIKTTAGEFDAHGFSKLLTGTVGPTSVNTTLYVFYSAGVGEVARIDHTDVHAFVLFNRDTRAGYLLEQTPHFTGP